MAREVTDGDPATDARDAKPTPPETILAEATNLRAERIREALDLARKRRLELVAMRAERDEAFRQRDAARESLDRLRRRRVVRIALSVVRTLHRLARGRRRASVAGTRTAPNAAPRETRPVAAAAPPRPRAEPGDPADYRTRLLARLRGDAEADVDAIRVTVVGADAAAATVATSLATLGWRVTRADAPPAPGSPTALDVAVLTRPGDDPRGFPRDAVTVAIVAGRTSEWTSTEWFDSVDIVLVRDTATADAIASSSAKSATVVPWAGDWPPADGIRDALTTWAASTRIAIMVQALRWDVAEPSGDYHLARGLQRQFERRGHPTSVYFQREWTRAATSREDVVIHLWGRYDLDVRPGQVNALWVLYHPELVTDELLHRYDAVFAASDELARRLSARAGIDVRSLHQATDPERFRPTPGGEPHELLFVGNSRGTRRTIIDDVTPSRHDLAVYGGGWEPELVDPKHVRGKVVANRDLPAFYSAAGIVLNDHWIEQVEAGLINNRLYDALAAGGFVISDRVPNLDAEFDGGVVTYDDAADLAIKVDRFLADPELRRPYVERGRAAVLARHTLAHRADDLLAALIPLVDARRAGEAPLERGRAAGPFAETSV